jgi:hypothetical protein
MMVLHGPKIIFLKSRKTAGSSIEIALSAFAKDGDIIAPIDDGSGDDEVRKALGLGQPQNYRKSLREFFLTPTYRDFRDLYKGKPLMKFHNHCAARRAKRHLGQSVWSRYTKISVVRNPWDYMVSSYYWGNRNKDTLPDFERWCIDNRRLMTRNRRQHFIGRQCIVDHFLCFERVGEDIKNLEALYPQLTGLAARFSDVGAKKGIRPLSGPSVAELFNNAPRADQLIATRCHYEIDRFNYKRPGLEVT